ncbi:MAG: preprotein translocase subunit YajC [Clostridiales bacterium]|nr:preprotein translocase subunit YajC [Clostridiales bacterium]
MNPNSPTFSLVLMVLLIALIYFMMIRPQRKKDKADREMREALKVGDEIITIGGIIGKVEKVNEKTVVISTTAAKNKIEFLKTAIASVSAKEGGSAKPAAKEETKAAEEEKKAPSRDKKVTPKKLGKKSEDQE